MKGLAKFMTANALQQRKVLRDFKNPDPEGQVQALYYREARDFIVAFHRYNYTMDWLRDRALSLRREGGYAEGRGAARLQNNARALLSYASNFGTKNFQVLQDIKFIYESGEVRITVVPDLHIRERGRNKLLKLDFAKEEPDAKVLKIVCQLMFEASSSGNLGFGSSDIMCLDVARGNVIKAARVGARLAGEIEAACQNISALWPTI